MIILYLADCNARLHPVYAAQDLVERCQDFDKARQLAKSQVSCAQLFYACIAPLCLTGDIDRVFSEWPTEPAPQIQVRIHKLKASVKDAKLIKANQEQIMGLANDIRKLTEHREKHCLMEGLNVPAITISLASLAVQCNCPELASSLIKSVKNTEKSSELYIRQQYAQTELSLYRLDKTHDTSKCLRVLEALSYTITEAKEHISLHHILEEGCVLIWNALIPVLHEKEPPMDQLSHILVGCSDALEAIKGRNHILRSKFYLEIASYYNCKNLTPQAAEHVTKGLSLDISGDPIKYEFLLIKKQLIVKGSKEFGLPGEERGNTIRDGKTRIAD